MTAPGGSVSGDPVSFASSIVEVNHTTRASARVSGLHRGCESRDMDDDYVPKTMNSTERKRAIELAKHQAHSIAGEFIAKGGRPNATERDRVLAETATLYLEIAKKKATLVDANDVARRLEAFHDFAEDRFRKIAEAAITVADQGNEAVLRALRQGAQQAVASVDVLHGEFLAWGDDQALAAWLEAADKLAMLEKPAEPSIADSREIKN
jgi:hypothetical protein